MREIEQAAQDFLARVPSYVWDGATLPVPIEEIADTHVGLLVRDVEDLATAPGAPPLGHGQALSGLLLPAAGEIWVNAEEARQWPARRSFTIAHELGHWRLHRNAERGVFCRSGSIEPEAPQARVPLPPAEDEAKPVRSRPVDAGAADPGAIRPMRPRLLQAVRHARHVWCGDGSPAPRGD